MTPYIAIASLFAAIFSRQGVHYYCRSIDETYRACSHGGANQGLLEEFDAQFSSCLF